MPHSTSDELDLLLFKDNIWRREFFEVIWMGLINGRLAPGVDAAGLEDGVALLTVDSRVHDVGVVEDAVLDGVGGRLVRGVPS